MSIKLIVGLGNPGSEYASTRHNAGALFVEYLCRQFGTTLRPDKKFHGLYAKISISGQDLHLLNPTTFMNRSGMAVQALCNYLKINADEVLVAHDELDIPCGAVKVKLGGGHGGHNGWRDRKKALGGNKDFYRLRLGIDHPGSKEKVVGFVLGQLGKSETQKLETSFDEVDRALSMLVEGEIAKATQRINSYKPE